MIFPFLPESAIDAKAAELLRRVFGASLDRSIAIDLEEIVCFLSEIEQLSFQDDADLRPCHGERVLGKTLPIKRKILLSRELKSDSEVGRRRFTLAHELGHWVLHRPLFVAQAQELNLFEASDDSEFEFVALNRSLFPAEGRRAVAPEEWQANRFAVSLLVDAAVLRNEFHRRFNAEFVARSAPGWRLESSSLRAHSRRLAAGSVDGLAPLREIFGLSTEAMAIALESRGYAVENMPSV